MYVRMTCILMSKRGVTRERFCRSAGPHMSVRVGSDCAFSHGSTTGSYGVFKGGNAMCGVMMGCVVMWYDMEWSD